MQCLTYLRLGRGRVEWHSYAMCNLPKARKGSAACMGVYG
jgi:hypothetical protein